MKQKYKFFWNKQGLNIHNLPLKIKRSSVSQHSTSGHLMCEDCFNGGKGISDMKQTYKCSACSTEKTIGNINARYMEFDGKTIVYTKDEYKRFMDQSETDTIRVLKELSTMTLPFVTSLIKSDYEIFGNDEKVIPLLQKIYQYLLLNNTMLLVKMSNKTGVIMSGSDRLYLFLIRDIRTIKASQQLGLTDIPLGETISNDLEAVHNASIDKEIDTFEKFKEFKLTGEPIKKIEIKVVNEPSSYVDDMSALEILA